MKKLKLLLDAKKLNFLIKNENIKKNFNKSLSKLIPISGTIRSKQLKFPLKVETLRQDNLLTFINNSKIVYKKKNNLSFLTDSSSLARQTNSETIFAKWFIIANNKKTILFNIITNNNHNLF